MEKPPVTVCMAHRNAGDFVEIMLYAFEKLSTYPYKLIIRDNSSTQSEFAKLKKVLAKYPNLDINLYTHETSLRGSSAHGETLNDLVTKIDTEYGVIMDTDATFLMKGWDKILIDSLTDKMPIYGTQPDVHGGKPLDFPLMFGVLFKTDVMKSLNVDWRPTDISKLQDVGWQCREKYHAAGLSGGVIYDFNTRTYKEGPYASIICSEYYLNPQDKSRIFASHFGRGSMPNSKSLIRLKPTNPLFKAINKVLLLPNYIKWASDKKKWINITKKIIDDESSR